MYSHSPLALLFASALVAQVLSQPDLLKIGSSAPNFKVSRTLKGKPHTALVKGKVYVVEFWATWCGPCRMSIPHLTELAKKHVGKATFIGVDVWERPKAGEDVDKLVDAFVKDMGSKMDYVVAQDTKDGQMAKAWLKAAEAPGIPMAFIVDAHGLIAWMGHPMELDLVLEDVLAGKHDVAAASAAYEKQRVERKRYQEQMASVRKAMEQVGPGISEAWLAKDFAGLLARVDQALATYPILKGELNATRFAALLHVNEADALSIYEAEKANQMELCQAITKEDGLSRSWYEKALVFLEAESSKPAAHPMSRLALARAYFRLGRNKEAAETQEKVLAYARNQKIPENQLKDLVADLQKYKDAK